MFGTGEAAELAYLTLKEHGLGPVAVFATQGGATFLGMPVHAVDSWRDVVFDKLIVATLDAPDVLVQSLVHAGIPSDKLLTMKPGAAHPGAAPSGSSVTPARIDPYPDVLG